MPGKRSTTYLTSEEDYAAAYAFFLHEDRHITPQRRRSFSEKKLDQVFRWIKQGRGQGRGEAYQPWLRITRGYSSPVSHMVFAALSVHRRNHHLLSKLEHHTGLLLAYLGATEMREGLPMWPTEHPHPLNPSVGTCNGLLAIADEANIEHGNFVGTNVPYVATLDFMATILWKGRPIHLGVSCKPEAIFQASQRARDRAQLDALYCQQVGALHINESGKSFHPQLIKNLTTYRPSLTEIEERKGTTQLEEFCACVNESGAKLPLFEAITTAGVKVDADHSQASQLWRVGLWMHQIDIDLTERVAMLQPMRCGGRKTREKLAQHFLGEMA